MKCKISKAFSYYVGQFESRDYNYLNIKKKIG